MRRLLSRLQTTTPRNNSPTLSLFERNEFGEHNLDARRWHKRPKFERQMKLKASANVRVAVRAVTKRKDSVDRNMNRTYTQRFQASGICVARGGACIIEDVSLVLEPGDAVLLRGPNGSGKTTLLRAFSGLLQPDAGEIAVFACDGRIIAEYEDALIYCGVANGTKNTLTVDENLRYWAALYGVSRTSAEAARAAFDLDQYAGRTAGALSTGLMRRLGLARLLIADRPIWLVDEPTAALDSASIVKLAGHFENHCARGGCVVVATHDDFELSGARNFHLRTAIEA